MQSVCNYVSIYMLFSFFSMIFSFLFQSSDDVSLSDSISLSSLDHEDYGIDYSVSETSQCVSPSSMFSEEVNLEDYEISAHIATTGMLIVIIIKSEHKLQF